jgi:hypothetical protein
LGAIDWSNDHFWDLKFSSQELAEGEKWMPSFEKFIAVSAGTKCSLKTGVKTTGYQLVSDLKNKLPGYGLVMLGAADEHSISQKCLDVMGRKWTEPLW